MDQGPEAGYKAVFPPVDQSTPIVAAPPETLNQVFTRILGYVDISPEFLDNVLATLRIRTFRKAMVLDEAQLKEVTDLSVESNEMGMRIHTLQFFSLLKAGDYYLKRNQVAEVPWNTFDEDAVYNLLTDFKLMNEERVEEMEKTRIEISQRLPLRKGVLQSSQQ